MMKNFFAIIVFLFCASFLFAGGKKDKPSKEEANPVTEEVKETLQEKSARILKENNGAAYTRDEIEGEVLEFDEVWGFALQERPDELDFDVPVTDIAVFTTTLTIYGELTDIPKSTLLSSFSGRKHLVFACDSRALMHFVLDPSFGIRKKVSSDLINACKNYDGLCIDLEYLPARDRGNFFSFLRDMKKMLNGKILSVCVPARTRTISDDMFNYKTISEIADRVIIMAYDEHWSTSRPGPVASLDWCNKVADYALTIIPKKKLIMGLPLYGRTWQEDKHAGAWYFSGANRKMLENNVEKIERDDGGVAKIEYSALVNVTGYFDDVYSLVKKMQSYSEKGMTKIGFWRLGQEDKLVWDWIKKK